VILLVLVVVLWIIVLAPSALRRIAERRGAGSIDHFHHQLQLLEHAGPKLVAPAYRLHTAVPGGRSVASPVPEVVSDRPKLFLLRPVDDEQSADIDGGDGAHYERVGVLEAPEPLPCPGSTPAHLAAERREMARHRCTLILRLLVTATISTGMLGMLPATRLAWICTGIFGAASLGLLALIGYARELAAQRAHRPAQRTHWSPVDYERDDVEEYGEDTGQYGEGLLHAAAAAGYPGAWDDGYDEWDEVPDRYAAAR